MKTDVRYIFFTIFPNQTSRNGNNNFEQELSAKRKKAKSIDRIDANENFFISNLGDKIKIYVDRKKNIRLEVLKNNTKAFFIYNKLGFRVYEDDGKIIKMEYKYDSTI